MLIRSKTNNKAKCERQRRIFSNSMPYPRYVSVPYYSGDGVMSNTMANIDLVDVNEKGEEFSQLFTSYVERPQVNAIVDALNEQLDNKEKAEEQS